MNPQVMLAYYCAIGVCALMAVVNAARYRKRGPAALAMAGAFLTFGGTAYLVIRNAPSIWVNLGLAATFALLVVDFVMRSATHGQKRSRR